MIITGRYYPFKTGAILLLFLFAKILTAQNLVPNGSFEENEKGKVTLWHQPSGEFYHYEQWLERKNKEILKNHVNGICLLDRSPSEFMAVELKHPLLEGKKYIVKMDVKIMFKDYDHDLGLMSSIDWLFLPEFVSVDPRKNIKGSPDISFDVSELISKKDFVTCRSEYIARGDEKILMIGKLKNIKGMEANFLYDSISQEYHSALAGVNFKRTNEVMNYGMTLMLVNKEKAMRKIKRYERKLYKSYKKEVDEIQALYVPALDSLKPFVHYVPGIGKDVRFYFDNVAIFPEDGDTTELDLTNNGEDFVIGEIYRFNNVVFDTDKDILKSQSFIELDNLVDILSRFPQYKVHLTGHTDSVNTDQYNLDLSLARANACRKYLIGKGVNAARITTEGKGENEPVVSNETEEGRAMNRRVEFILKVD